MTHEEIKQGMLRAQEKLQAERNKSNEDSFNRYKRAYNISLINLSINKYKKQ